MLLFSLTPLAIAVLTLSHSGSSQAQLVNPATPTSPTLQLTPLLREDIAPETLKGQPTFVYGERISGRPDIDTKIEGHAELRRAGTVIRADKLEYDALTDKAIATGNVRLNHLGDVYEGTLLDLKVDSFSGFFNQPRYQFLKNEGQGEGERVEFIDDKHSIIQNASYSTCRRYPGPDWMPDWILKAASISIDNEEDIGQATDAWLSFKGLSVPLPSISFPLSSKRKSGWLPPTYATDNINGVELTTPYYVNIAPNRDATIFPSISSKRGLNVGAEFRYLENSYNGQLRADVMPSDPLRDRMRWGVAGQHLMRYDTGLGSVGLNLNVNRVSDDDYWRDFPRATTSLTQRLLATDAALTLDNENLSLGLRVSKWQTLKDTTAPIIPPYDRLPQLTARYTKNNLAGFDFSLSGDVTRFASDSSLTLQPNANRAIVLAQLSRPWVSPGWFFTPKLQLNASKYQFDAPLSSGVSSATRTVPTFSLDSGLLFERDTNIFGRAVTQTLEPRAFYVYTPFRDQSLLPVYDTSANDFNFASTYLENPYSGGDRIADNNLLTLGATSRFLDPSSGAELARFAVAQRLRFQDQRVTLPGGSAVTDRFSDLLIGASVNVSPTWSVDTTQQYNPDTSRVIRSTIGTRYSPSNYRVVNLAYRLQKGSSEQIDLGWQWPLNDLWGDRGQDLGAGRGQGEGRWYSVGRLNFSVTDRKLVDSVFGFEYDAGCWLGRVVVENLARSDATSNKRALFQLELVGFARLGGAGTLSTLKNNIPRYQYLREQVTPPSRFSSYD
ncbi:MAG: LPS-assembly protein LptD [Burkholderiaceae bacterium]|nr:LPS-assembly protein LptD [Burkholderiaceae bacterium]